jgi:hypothetical protein
MKRRHPAFALAALTCLAGCGENEQALVSGPEPSHPSPVTWSQVRPIIEAHCVRCHATFIEESVARDMSDAIVEEVGNNPMHGSGTVAPLTRGDWSTLIDWAKGDRR